MERTGERIGYGSCRFEREIHILFTYIHSFWKVHADFVLVPADKAANSMTVVCKKYHTEISMKEFGKNITSNTNSIYVPCADSVHEILGTHANFVNSVRLEMPAEEDKNLPFLYWTPKLHKNPFKNHFSAYEHTFHH